MSTFGNSLDECLKVMESLRPLSDKLTTAAKMCEKSLLAGGKLLICGNGGSSAEAQHLTGELVGRYKENRAPFAAITLSADAAVLTCIGNDYCYEDIFSRQVEALGRPGDLLIAFTTSGKSPNVLKALETANKLGIESVAFLGRDGGSAALLATCSLIVGHMDTARIQEGHQFLMHSLMDQIEAGLKSKS